MASKLLTLLAAHVTRFFHIKGASATISYQYNILTGGRSLMNQTVFNSRNYFFVSKKFFIAALVMAVFLLQGCEQNKPDLKKEDLKTEYQSVFLSDGAAFFGKIKTIAPQFIELTDVYYIKSTQNIETKQIENKLVKRGKELHGPDVMYISRHSILMIESISPDSQIGILMKKVKENVSTDVK